MEKTRNDKTYKNSMNNNGVANSFDKDSLHIISSFVSQLVAKESYNVLLPLGRTLSKPVQQLVASPHHTSVIIRRSFRRKKIEIVVKVTVRERL